MALEFPHYCAFEDGPPSSQRGWRAFTLRSEYSPSETVIMFAAETENVDHD